jgi:hypothetical protein
MNPNQVSIFVRNKYLQTSQTFMITIEDEPDLSGGSQVFGVVSIVLFILMIIFICICVGAIIRLCLKKRQLQQ